MDNRDLILIIDDDKNVLWLMRRMLEIENYAVEQAELGREGLAVYSKQRPSLVLVDAMMPGLSGFEVCEAIQRLPPEERVPIIMITALNDQASIDRAFAAGATDYITKPVLWPILRHRIRLMLATEHAERKLIEQHNLLRTLIDNIPDAIYVKDTEQRFILSNVANTGQVMANTNAQQAVPIVADVLPSDLPPQQDSDDQQVLDSGQSVLNGEIQYVDSLGKHCWNLTTRVALRDHDGKISGVVGISRDITARKETDALILQSEERFRLLVKNSSELITVLNEDGRITYQSDSIERVIGFQASSWIGQSMQQFIYPEDWPGFKQLLSDICTGTGHIFKVSCRVKNNANIWLSLEGSGYWLDNPSVSGVVINVHDMTEYRQIEASLLNAEAAEHEQRLLAEALRDTAAALANTLDPEMVMHHILISIGRVVPHETADIMLVEGNDVHIVASRGHEPLAEEQIKNLHFSLDTGVMRQIVQTHTPFIIGDTLAYPDWVVVPETAWIRSYICAPIEVHGHIIGFLNLNSRQPDFYNAGHGQRLQAFADQVGMAIENAHLYEQLRAYTGELELLIDVRTGELNRAKEHVEAILDSTSDAIVVIDVNGHVQQTNRSFDHLFDYHSNEILGQHLTSLTSPVSEGRVTEALEVTRRSGDSRRIDIDAVRRDGTTFTADISFSTIQHGEGKSSTDVIEVVCSIRDMTEHKQIEMELQRLNQLKNEFLSTAAHELRTPLSSILGFSELLITRSFDSDRSQRYIKIINEQSTQLTKIVDALLDISRIESKQGLALELKPINMGDFIPRILAYFSEYLPKYEFKTVGLEECPAVIGDEARLSQVLQNLISNAIKYSPNGGQIVIQGEFRNDELQVSIQDWGIGMTEEQQTHLFERFYRADSSNTTISGTGLGLAISKLIVELHGGHIWAQSTYHQGTTISFTLPSIGETSKPNKGLVTVADQFD